MIRYNPNNWAYVLLGVFRSPVSKTLALDVIGVGIYAALVVWLERDIARIPRPFGLPVLSLLGIILGLLLVFRTNTAYERWWEGRRLWGQLVNCSRALARQLGAMLPPDATEARQLYRELLGAFPACLTAHLRAIGPTVDRSPNLEDAIAIGPNVEGRARLALELKTAPHAPNRILSRIAKAFHSDINIGLLPADARISLISLLGEFDQVAGGCERIRRTPIPYSYSSYIRQFIFLFALAVPFAMAPEYGYGTVIASMFLFFSTMGLELLATEVEEPFGTDANDLPLDEIALRIAENVEDLLTFRG